MSLLATLNLHKNFDELHETLEPKEYEFKLESWGEIFPPFGGNREHSLAARYILQDFPFKLFCMSTPHDAGVPQHLCLTFREPIQTKKLCRWFIFQGIFQ